MTPTHENRRRDDQLKEEVERVTAIVQTRLHPGKIVLWISVAGLLGAFLPVAGNFLGIRFFGPAAAVAASNHRIDTVEMRLTAIEASQREMRTLVTAYVASSCLDSVQVVRLRQALVPCRTLLDEVGVLR